MEEFEQELCEGFTPLTGCDVTGDKLQFHWN